MGRTQEAHWMLLMKGSQVLGQGELSLVFMSLLICLFGGLILFAFNVTFHAQGIL